MKNKNKTKKFVIVAALILVIIIALVLGLSNSKKKTSSSSRASSASSATQATDNSSDNPAPNSAANNNISSQSLSKPSLTMSSGNNGPVPAGITMNFICRSELNSQCSILLTNGSKQATLGPTKITDNGRGDNFASFYWTSVPGNYKVSARSVNPSGVTSDSSNINLEVQ